MFELSALLFVFAEFFRILDFKATPIINKIRGYLKIMCFELFYS